LSNGCALINLVRLNTSDETNDTDYTAGELFVRHDEIKLEDPNGIPCAIPRPTQKTNLDYRFDYITGSIGSQGRIMRRKLSINIDYITNEKCRLLERWQDERAYVLVAPNMGRNTEFSFRPVRMAGTDYLDGGTAYDLTGNHAIQFTQSANTVLMWDESLRMFQKKSASDVLPIFHTQGGGGVGAPRSVRNLMDPPYPTGDASGTGVATSGWVKGGTDLAQLTFTSNTGGFGHPDCPDTITVNYTNDVSVSRLIEIKGLFDPLDGVNYGGIEPTGSGDMVICPWVRGQFPDGAELFLIGPTGITSQDISGMRFDGWTPLPISRHEADWSLAVPNYFINLPSTLGVAGSFEIGPTMVTQFTDTGYNAGPYWTDIKTPAGTNYINTVSGFQFPAQGTAMCSFVLPEDWGNDYTSGMIHGLLGSTSLSMRVGKLDAGDHYIQIVGGDNQTLLLPSSNLLLAGKINTAAFTWNGTEQAAYVNGVLVNNISMATKKIDFGASSTALRIGYDKDSRTMYPGILLSARIDEGAMTASDVANIHLALTDPVALQFAMIQRGRVYQITGIPQTVRVAQGGSQVLGQLTLEQVDYQHWLADPLNTEEVVR